MLKRHFALVNFMRISLDLLTIGVLWNAVYFLRFYSGWFDHSGIPPYPRHLMLTLPVGIILYLCRHWTGIYRSMRVESTIGQFGRQIQSIFLGYIFVVFFFYYFQKVPYTRVFLLLFFVSLLLAMLATQCGLSLTLRILRSKGYNQRHFAIIGTGKHAIKLLRDIQDNSYMGLTCSFLIDNKPQLEGKSVHGVRVFGDIGRLVDLAIKNGIDEVYLAANGYDIELLQPVLVDLQNKGITLRIQPNWGNLTSVTRLSSVKIGSSVLFSANESPLTGMNIVFKDLMDRGLSLLLLCLFSVPMLLIALLIKVTSKGPVFYRQVRIGMDHKPFTILKFRTMHVNEDNGAGWTLEDDPRRTPVGQFLRLFSLDELPQLINVLKGQMSLVGPRPERPHFVRQFSDEYKKYMFRHKVKAGMTGWAQIHGFRGNSSLRKRTQYDLYYIRNWSFWLDLLILIRTPLCILTRKNAC
ncbi:MAG: undecaprenyl-phosphate glucose phosphotransferase [Planctomycetota bacterium]|jgi:exopolysaccharide biosynthesis polyprenyl glycosylphosphotransferase